MLISFSIAAVDMHMDMCAFTLLNVASMYMYMYSSIQIGAFQPNKRLLMLQLYEQSQTPCVHVLCTCTCASFFLPSHLSFKNMYMSSVRSFV